MVSLNKMTEIFKRSGDVSITLDRRENCSKSEKNNGKLKTLRGRK